jgi:hypothetical protein
MKKNFQFESTIWLYPGESGAWHFISLPKDLSAKLREKYKGLHRGWNSLKAGVGIGKTKWETSIFYDTKSERYILPVKAIVRRKEHIFDGDKVKVVLKLI